MHLPLLLACLMLLPMVEPYTSFHWPSIEAEYPDECRPNSTFDITSFSCYRCPKDSRPKKNGYGCECLPGWIVEQDTGSYDPGDLAMTADSLLRCRPCPEGTTPTKERDSCIRCLREGSCECMAGEITVERSDDGSALSAMQCAKCAPGFEPNFDATRCVPCRRPPIMSGAHHNCNCTMAAGVCLPRNLGMDGIYSPNPSDEVVKYGDSEVRSAFFKEHVKVAAYLCYTHHNATSCQLLANLCALALHDKTQKACDLIFDWTKRKGLRHIPQLYFSEPMSSSITRKDILNTYNVRGSDSRLNITAAKYSLRGELLSVTTLDGAILQMCNGSFSELDAAFNFATRYHRACKDEFYFREEVHFCKLYAADHGFTIPSVDCMHKYLAGKTYTNLGVLNVVLMLPLHKLFRAPEPEFYDLYIPYTADKERKMFAVPILLENYGSNKASDDNKWAFTSRLFLVDTVGGIPVSSALTMGSQGGHPTFIRYLSKVAVKIQLLNTRENPKEAGRIYPPVIKVSYTEATTEDLANGAEANFEFSVDYQMEKREAKKDIEISVGVMSVFAVLWAAMETWSWSRRSGKVSIDPITLVKLVAFTCGTLAHVFLAVFFFASLYWFVFFKQQTYLYVILPSLEQESKVKHYLVSIFALKIVDIIHLLVVQISVDVFLLDWERPHAVAATATSSAKEMAVSAWRTYLVANEWNELQTKRKTSIATQIIVVVFLLKVCGLENVATADPLSSFSLDDGLYHSPPSFICRFALGVCVYGGVAILQVIFWCGIYAMLIEDKLEQFTDVCSLANISVFVMVQHNFGYYIHGKSAHGFADTDMATLMEQLRREADDSCGHRGLQAGSDEQAFVMLLPAKLRTFYDKIVLPAADATTSIKGTGGLNSGSSAGSKKSSSTSGGASGPTGIIHMVEASNKMNKFLTRFLEHALRDLDYEVREKLFLEKVMDIEFQDASMTEKAIFYSGTGYSFASVLLYGHEFSLAVFDMIVFLFVDLLAQDFLLAGIVAFIIGQSVKFVRQTLGKRNLARKTLIDKRFLI